MENNLDKQYTDLLQDILDNGVKKQDRTGTGTLSVFGRQIRHKMSDGFPLLTTKKMAWKSIVTELLWFLRGDTNIKFLVDNGCHIWDGDAYKNYLNVVMFEKPGYLHEKHGHLNMSIKKEGDNYLPFTQEEFINKIKTDDKFRHWGELGKIYGKQWRKWREGKYTNELVVGGLEIPDGPSYWKEGIDQITNLINDLKTNPDSRRLMVNAWNVGELDQMVLPPCHYGFQVYTRELSLEERLCIADKFNPLIREDCLTKTHHTDETEELKLVYRHEFLDSLGPNVVPQRRAISLMFNMRSTDVGLGLSFNLSSYGLLLMMIAKQVNMVPDELIYNGGDVHLYLNHIEPIKEQLTREPYELPTVKISDRVVNDISEYTLGDIILENYQSHPTIKAPLSN
jgi:thymidylate synthase